jgi:[protein-PII] uridylyltransferase
MPTRLDHIPDRRAIVDRRALADRLAALPEREARLTATAILKEALAEGRAEIARRLEERPYAGTETAAAYAFLTDQILRLIHDFIVGRLYPQGSPTDAERLLLMAVGGYGRGEMALHSDVDIAFVTPWKPTPWTEQVIESILYLLWDLGLKVGHSSRSLAEMVGEAQKDHTVRTALLEARYLWGDEGLFEEAEACFRKEVVAGKAREFVTGKLEERNERHRRMGDSRYVVEPNVKEGKGGLRDLHTLFWIGKYVYKVGSVAELVEVGLLTPAELRQFQRAERFLWAVRCHLHIVAGRAEERLTFDYQREIAERMNYADRPGKSPVERFMRHYFLHAKTVGDLSGVFLAHLDEKFARSGRRFGLPALRRRPRKLEGFVLDRGRLALPNDDFFREQPIRLLRIFALADRYGLEIHPLAMRAAARDSKLIDASVRADSRANALFLDVLTSPRDPETVLRWMNEAGVFGRFVPEFGRVVAQMQFDMYHHYTVDEHTIRAMGLLARIEKGELKEEHPLSSSVVNHIASRRALYCAVLLHDIAKGRGGDHSGSGAEVARTLCPRLGPQRGGDRHRRLAGALAPPHVRDGLQARFVRSQDRSRLRRAGEEPGAAAPALPPHRGRYPCRRPGRLDRLEAPAVAGSLRVGGRSAPPRPQAEGPHRPHRGGAGGAGGATGWEESRFARLAWRLPESYWLSEPPEVLESNARLMDAADREPDTAPPLATSVQEERGATLVSAYARDQPGLFYRLTGAISLAGGNIIDARIHTTEDGMAIDNFLVQDFAGRGVRRPGSPAPPGGGGDAGDRGPGAGDGAARGEGAAARPRPRLHHPPGRLHR